MKVYGKHEVVELREFLELDRASMTLFLRNQDASATGTDSYVFSCDQATVAFLNKLAREQTCLSESEAIAPTNNLGGNDLGRLTVTYEDALYQYSQKGTNLAELDPSK